MIEIIQQRLIVQRRAGIAVKIKEARVAYQQDKVQRSSVADLMKELEG